MVKFRGIEISVVSQFDIRRLPEFAHRTSPVGKFDATSASCYIPTYPGSQIWFEYMVDGPHPPNAAYYFKLFINQFPITSWDCTAVNGYYGKASYCLQHSTGSEGNAHSNTSTLERRAFQFSNREEDEQQLIALNEDCIEICVYRIEHRQRIRHGFEIPKEQLSDHYTGKLKLVNGGVLEAGRPQRRYKYQLLDPLDAPFARFRFFYRSFEWLESHGLLQDNNVTVDESPTSSTIWYDPNQIDLAAESSPSGYGSPDYSLPWILSSPEQSPVNSPARKGTIVPPKSVEFIMPDIAAQLNNSSDPIKHLKESKGVSSKAADRKGGSPSSLSLATKGSIEELVSSVPRSPQSPKKRATHLQDGTDKFDLHPLSHLSAWASRRYCVSALKSAAHYGNSDNDKSRASKSKYDRNKNVDTDENSNRRPVSPFSRGGFLSRMRSPTPPQISFLSGRSSKESKDLYTIAPSGQNCIKDDAGTDTTSGSEEQAFFGSTAVTTALGGLKRMFNH